MKDDNRMKGFAFGETLIVDEQGAEELRAVQEEFLARMGELEAESMKRSAESGEPTEPILVGVYRKEHRFNNN